ncbi:MAG: hypothetical protein MUE44_17430 [Oscillatoriaceae cyanobacterium Prado104]|jgi:hypothetical protein|nr:hypothetical protein [Oscillatoriaceae cyanobacterium Prado104]
MKLNLLDAIGNWNPQLFRELKGRLKIGNVAIASILSLGGQLLLFLYVYVQPNVGTFDSQDYWLDLFVLLSIFSTIGLLVAGTYMLVSDLDKEERRGTLNFIRLSPQPATAIFTGKILGVPILLYLAGILAIPLHLYSGLRTQIPLHYILCFYVAIAASCALFYSSAMLFGLTTSWLGGFQPWLASAAVFVLSWISALPLTRTAWDGLAFSSPVTILKYLLFGVVKKGYYFYGLVVADLEKLQWFYSPVGTNIASAIALYLSICALGTYWMWQGWQRRFPNPNTTVLSKQQSYLLVICFQSIILGFALQSNSSDYDILSLLIFNLLMFLALIAALTSDRQSLYDWARYRKQIVRSDRRLWRCYPLLDLIWSEKSPAMVAIAIDFLISVIILIPWVLLEKVDASGFGLILCLNLILIYATIAQIFLFTQIPCREILAISAVSIAISGPILFMLSNSPGKAPILWLSSAFGIGCLWSSKEPVNTFLISILCQWSVLLLLNIKLMSQLKTAGQSASKALLKT